MQRGLDVEFYGSSYLSHLRQREPEHDPERFWLLGPQAVVAEVLVTRMGVEKVMVAGVTVRLGLGVWPVPVDWGLVVPVMRTVKFWSRVRVVVSAEGVRRDW